MKDYVRHGKVGAVVVGSHVKKTTEQLAKLLTQPGIVPIEVNVERIANTRVLLLDEITQACHVAHQKNMTPVIYTSRMEKQFASQAERLAFGEAVSALLMDVVRKLPADLGYLISKGGITSNDVLSSGLALKKSEVLGQILPGCSVVRCPDDHPRFANMPVVIFPGNVGDEQALVTAYHLLK
jgi:uncharacterized protein YgbK (DUF1537 family)